MAYDLAKRGVGRLVTKTPLDGKRNGGMSDAGVCGYEPPECVSPVCRDSGVCHFGGLPYPSPVVEGPTDAMVEAAAKSLWERSMANAMARRLWADADPIGRDEVLEEARAALIAALRVR